MWLRILAHLLIMKYTLCNLTGDYICKEEKSTTVNVTKYVVRNITVRDYKWCYNVPPRCSFYFVKPVNASEIVEEEQKTSTEVCCSGYKEDHGICVPECEPKCVNGKCDGSRKCICYEGFYGPSCDSTCNSTHPTGNCHHSTCQCDHGHCQEGSCTCFPGWHGPQCEFPCADGYFGDKCAQSCLCEAHLCNRTSGECLQLESTSSTDGSTTTEDVPEVPENLRLPPRPKNYKPTLQKYHLFDVTTRRTFSVNVTTDIAEVWTEPPVNKSDHQSSNSYNRNKTTTKPTTNVTSSSSLHGKEIEPTSVPVLHVTSRDDDSINQHGTHVGINATNHLIGVTKSPASPTKAKVDPEVNTTAIPVEENYSYNYRPQDVIHQEQTWIGRGLLLSIGVAIAVSAVVIVIAIVVISLHRCKSREVKEKSSEHRTSSVSVYTHSVIQATLPDVPDCSCFPYSNLPNFADSDAATQGFKTYVLCNMNAPHSHNINNIGIPTTVPAESYDLYDHPPSTGSYRAAPLPEPPNFEMKTFRVDPLNEPLYDEIPSSVRPAPASPPPSYTSNESSFYMNFSERTNL